MVVRQITHGLGYRYRLHYAKLPGRPDLVFPARKKAIFVHGCFWHRHEGCDRTRTPKSRVEFWTSKFEGNIARDRANRKALDSLGWQVLVIWECETEVLGQLSDRIVHFLNN
jgi:DNA mismatch endonuclease (patch repair protein)